MRDEGHTILKRTLRMIAAPGLALATLTVHAQAPASPVDLRETLELVGKHLTQFYERARSVVCIETVVIQTLTSSFSPDGPSRELKYELRIEWNPDDGAEAKIVRELIAVGGRPPRAKDKPGCMDPKSASVDSLALLLPAHRNEYAFSWAGAGRAQGRASVMLDYKGVGATRPAAVWHDDCVSVDLSGRTRGRVWVDAATGDVVRLDEHLLGIFEFPVPRDRAIGPQSLVIERADSSVTYRPVAFHDPEETIMLPASILSMTMIRSGATSSRITQTFSGYRRFVTAGRVVTDGS
jgi:hypothetical protein